MDPSRKRRLRLVVALTTAVVLAGALVYTSFSASTTASKPSEVARAGAAGGSYELTGRVVGGTARRDGDGLRFRIRDRDGHGSLPVVYSGVVPDAFRGGREVIVKGRLRDGTFQAEHDSLVTKCPSKFTKKKT